MEFIDLKTQYLKYKKDIDTKMKAVMDHGQFIMGPEIEEMETKLADFTRVKHCISVSSGTHSLEIALRALNIGPGDEVITVPFSWISSAEVIPLVGAKPVFVDIEKESYNMDPNLLNAAITENTKAIMPVSLFGQMPNLEAIQAIADKYEIPVIEDAAQSFGATRNGVNSCGASLIGSTSFFPAKPLGCYGDGGALFTDDNDLATAIKAIRTHGGVRRHHHTLVGTNGRFDTLQAAVILGKLPYFENELKARATVGDRYDKLIREYCTVPEISKGNTHVYAQYTLRANSGKRDSIVEGLKKEGIPVAVYYPTCFHEQPVFEYLGYQWGDFPESEKASREVFSLPMHPFLTEEEQQLIAERLTFVLEKNS